MRAFFVAVGLATALALSVAGCFSPMEPTCSFACADTDPKCPTDYTCKSDGYCHLHDDNSMCGFSDASVPNDLATPTGDLSGTAGSDLSSHD